MLVEHHIKYKEIHGVDETVWMTVSEHRKLHARLRREGNCNIPVEQLSTISMAAYYRTQKGKEYLKSDICKQRNKNYINRAIQRISFSINLVPYVDLCEHIAYNKFTGTVTCTAGFQAHHYQCKEK